MVEFAVALVVIMILIAGLLQIGALTHASTTAMAQARDQAGSDALAPVYYTASDARYIEHWRTGPDDRRYTRDDIHTCVFPAELLPRNIVTQGRVISGTEDGIHAPDNAFSSIYASIRPIEQFRLVKGHASQNIAIIPIIRRLVFNQTELTVASDAWLTWAEGIY